MQCTYYTATVARIPALEQRRTARRRRKRRNRIAVRAAMATAILLATIAGCATGLVAMKTDAEAMEAVEVRTETVTPERAASEPETSAPAELVRPYSIEEAAALAKAMWGEARGCGDTQMAAVGWCALNRVDAGQWPDDLIAVLAQPNQFCGYDPEYPVEQHILEIACSVLDAWHFEKETGITSPDRVLPANYYFFTGDGHLNYFRTAYEDTGAYWDWSMPSPYEN